MANWLILYLVLGAIICVFTRHELDGLLWPSKLIVWTFVLVAWPAIVIWDLRLRTLR